MAIWQDIIDKRTKGEVGANASTSSNIKRWSDIANEHVTKKATEALANNPSLNTKPTTVAPTVTVPTVTQTSNRPAENATASPAAFSADTFSPKVNPGYEPSSNLMDLAKSIVNSDSLKKNAINVALTGLESIGGVAGAYAMQNTNKKIADYLTNSKLPQNEAPKVDYSNLSKNSNAIYNSLKGSSSNTSSNLDRMYKDFSNGLESYNSASDIANAKQSGQLLNNYGKVITDSRLINELDGAKLHSAIINGIVDPQTLSPEQYQSWTNYYNNRANNLLDSVSKKTAFNDLVNARKFTPEINNPGETKLNNFIDERNSSFTNGVKTGNLNNYMDLTKDSRSPEAYEKIENPIARNVARFGGGFVTSFSDDLTRDINSVATPIKNAYGYYGNAIPQMSEWDKTNDGSVAYNLGSTIGQVSSQIAKAWITKGATANEKFVAISTALDDASRTAIEKEKEYGESYATGYGKAIPKSIANGIIESYLDAVAKGFRRVANIKVSQTETNWIKDLLTDAIGEGKEEVLQGLVDALYNFAAYGDYEDFKDENGNFSFMKMIAVIGEEGLYGFAGGLFGGGVSKVRYDNYIKSDEYKNAKARYDSWLSNVGDIATEKMQFDPKVQTMNVQNLNPILNNANNISNILPGTNANLEKIQEDYISNKKEQSIVPRSEKIGTFEKNDLVKSNLSNYLRATDNLISNEGKTRLKDIQTVGEANAKNEGEIKEFRSNLLNFELESLRNSTDDNTNLGENGSVAFLNSYDDKNNTKNVADYETAFQQFYQAGKLGIPFGRVLETASFAHNFISADTMEAAYKAGTDDRKVILQNAFSQYNYETQLKEAKNSKTGGIIKNEFSSAFRNENKFLYTVIDNLSRGTGVKVLISDRAKGNGNFHDKVVEININSKDGIGKTFFHELTHNIAKDNNAFKSYKSTFIDYLVETKQYDTIFTNYDEEYHDLAVDYLESHNLEVNDKNIKEYVDEEIVADLAGNYLTDEKYVRSLVNKDRRGSGKIQNAIRDLAANVKSIVDSVKKSSVSYEKYGSQIEVTYESLKKAEKLFADLIKEYDSNNVNSNETSSDEVRYSINFDFANDFDNWDKKDRNGYFVLGKTSKALKSIGLFDYKIVIDKTKLIDIQNKHHEMTDDLIKKIPLIIENPLLILKSQSVEGRIVIFNKIFDNSGKPILAAMELNPDENNANVEKIYKIASVYRNENNSRIQKWINDTSNILYIDNKKNRTLKWLNGLGLQLPVPINQLSSINKIIPQTEQKVNKIEKDLEYTRFSLDETESELDVQTKINQSMTMADAKDMVQRAFVVNNIKDFYDDKYSNGDEWLKGEGINEVDFYIENTEITMSKYMNPLWEKDNGFDDDYSMSDILQAYLDGTLTGETKEQAERIDTSKGTNVIDNRFYSPRKIELTKELYENASKRVTNSNRQEVYKARADFIIAAHNSKNYDSIGLTQKEVNAKIRSWSNYSSSTLELSNSLNKGVADSNKWSGLENSSIVNQITISNEELAKMVKDIQGDSNGWQRKYITSTMLAIDTHIDYSDLTFEFDKTKELDEINVGGVYNVWNRTIKIGKAYLNTVAHEMGHYLDHKWGREFGGGNSLISDIVKKSFKGKNYSNEQILFLEHFKDFMNNIEKSSERGDTLDYKGGRDGSYWQRPTETFARFIGLFTEWVNNTARNSKTSYEDKFYHDRFTVSQFKDFVKILQEKSALDIVKQEVEETRFSLDSEGRELSAEQTEFFKDSQARDDEGRLKVLYHGTNFGGFNTFDTKDNTRAVFLSDDRNVAKTYNDSYDVFFYNTYSPSKYDAEEDIDNQTIYELYANIKKPLVLECNYTDWNKIDINKLPDYISSKIPTQKILFGDYVTTNDVVQAAIETGKFDSVIFKDISCQGYGAFMIQPYEMEEYGFDEYSQTEDITSNVYAVFNPNALKSINNTEPTENDDIRFSLDSEGREINFKNHLFEVYHGSTKIFNTFDTSHKNRWFKDSNVNFFTDNQNVSDSYGNEQYKSFVKFSNPYILEGETDGYSLEYSKTGKAELAENKEIISTIQKKLDSNGSKYWKKSFNTVLELILNNKANVLSREEIDYLINHPFSLAYLSFKAKEGFLPYSNGLFTNDIVNAVLAINEKIDSKYDGVVFDSIQDSGRYYSNESFEKSNVFVTFDNSNIISTDSKDIKFSLDSEGRELSAEQQEFFKKSKVRDDNGNLLVVYHGTGEDFNVYKSFKNEFYFTSNKQLALWYANEHYNGKVNEQFLLIKKPLRIDAKGKTYNQLAHSIREKIDKAKEQGYDGVIIKNIVDTPSGWYHDEKMLGTNYIVFNSNQIKNIDNLNPTDSEDIRYSFGEDRLWDKTLGSESTFRYSIDNNQNVPEMSIDFYRNQAIKNIDDVETQQLMNDLFDELKEYRELVNSGQLVDRKLSKLWTDIEKDQVKQEERIKRQEIIDKYKEKLETSKKELAEVKQKDKEEIARIKKTNAVAKRWTDAEVKEQIAKVKEKDEKRIAELKQKAKDSKAKAKERRTVVELKHVVTKQAKELGSMLMNPTDKKHVPENFRKELADFLTYLDFTTDKQKESTQLNLQNLIMKYRDIADRQDQDWFTITDGAMGNYQLFDDTVYSMMRELDGKRIADMDVFELSFIETILKSIKTRIYNANKLFLEGRYLDISEITSESLKGIKENSDYKGGPASPLLASVNNMARMQMLRPIDYFEAVGLNKVYNGLRKSYDDYIDKITIAKDFVENELLSNKELLKSIQDEKLYKFKLENGQEISLTKGQLLTLYNTNKREQARGHIYGFGIKPADAVVKSKEVEDGTPRWKTSYKRTVHYSPVQVTEKDVMNMINTLSEEEIALADNIMDFFEVYAKSWINTTTLRMYGYEKATAENYFPIFTDNNFLDTNFDVFRVDPTINNWGSLKNTDQGAKNAIIIKDILDIFTEHISKSAMYSAFAESVDATKRVINYKNPTDGSIKDLMDTKFGHVAFDYLKNFMFDVQAGMRTDKSPGWWTTLMKNYKSAVIGANIRSVAQQPTAYTKALTYMDPKYLVNGITTKSVRDEMYKYSRIARYKHWGFSNMDIGRDLRSIMLDERKLTDWAFEGLQFADDFTWGKLWNAVKLEIADTRPEITDNEEFMKAVADRFDYIIDKTQVVDSVFHKADVLRQKDSAWKVATAFMSEPTAAYSMLASSVKQYNKDKTQDNLKQVYRTFSTVGLTMINTATVCTLVDLFWRKIDLVPDDDKDKWYMTWLNNILDQITGLLPGVKELGQIIMGYEPSRMEWQLVVRAWNAISALSNYVSSLASGDDSVRKNTLPVLIKNVVACIADLGGIPANDLLRELDSAANATLKATKDYKTYYAYTKTQLSPEYSTNKSKYMDILWEAYKRYKETGDKTDFEFIKDDLENEHGYSEKYIQDSLKKRDIKEVQSNKELESAYKDYLKSGDDSKLTKEIDSLLEEEKSNSVIKKALENIKKEALGEDTEKAVKYPTPEKVAKALKAGDKDLANRIANALIDKDWTKEEVINAVDKLMD